jgi:hypothetical protein
MKFNRDELVMIHEGLVLAAKKYIETHSSNFNARAPACVIRYTREKQEEIIKLRDAVAEALDG